MDQRLLPLVLLAIIVCALVNPGNFGTIDTTRRMQVERWIRLGEPPVRPEDGYFGVTGRGGVRHAIYGVGQSLLLIPFDAAASAALAPVNLSEPRRQQAIELLVAFLMQSFVSSLTVMLAFRVLELFGFPPRASMAGAMALLFATMYLQYVQCAQENNLLMLLALCSLYGIRRWHGAGDIRWAVLAGAACGYAMLVRLPSAMETGVLLGFALSVPCDRGRFLLGYLPPVAAALLIDRWYHLQRFGELFSTYMGIVGRQLRPPGVPGSFPFSYPFWKGFWGTLFSADKSIFLFDPLLLVLILVAVWRWREIPAIVRRALLWLCVLLLGYISFYATYYDFGGDVAWGHRFVTLPVQLLCLFAVPLLLTAGGGLPKLMRLSAWSMVGIAVVLQAASTTLAPNLEVAQRLRGSHSAVIVNRAVNLATIARGDASGRFAGMPVEWHSLYYFPFQLRLRFPQFAPWAIAVWSLLLAALLYITSRMRHFR